MTTGIKAVLLVMTFLCIGWLGHKLDNMRTEENFEALVYIPKNKELRSFAFGFENEYADFLWVFSLQSVNRNIIHEVPFDSVSDVFDMITSLDPRFKTAYSMGSFFISECKDSPLEGIQLLEKGTRLVPEEPWSWYALGYAYWMERVNLEKHNGISLEESTNKAFFAAQKAVDAGGDEFAQVFLRFLTLKDRAIEFDILVWFGRYSQFQKSDAMKKLIEEKIQTYLIDIQLEFWKSQIAHFENSFGELPTSLELFPYEVKEPQDETMPQIMKELSVLLKEALTNGNIRNVLVDYALNQKHPENKNYLYNPGTGEVDGLVRQKVLLDDTIRKVKTWIHKFFLRRHLRLPKSLEELGKEFTIPELPLKKKYVYDPETGKLSYTPKD